MATHEFKTWPDPFQAIIDGHKRFEWRKDDREPQVDVGDYLHLREWQPSQHAPFEVGSYTGRLISTPVTYALRGPAFGMPEGYVVMSLGQITLYPRISVFGDLAVELDRLRAQVNQLNKGLIVANNDRARLREALSWCGGSPSFTPEGEAHEGWMKLVAPLLNVTLTDKEG